MPRRFTFRRRSTVPGIARELLRCFEDPNRWTTGAAGRDVFSHEVTSDSPDAVCWCTSGAANRVTAEEGDGRWDRAAYVRFRKAFKRAAGHSMEQANDLYGLPAVRRALRKLAKAQAARVLRGAEVTVESGPER